MAEAEVFHPLLVQDIILRRLYDQIEADAGLL